MPWRNGMGTYLQEAILKLPSNSSTLVEHRVKITNYTLMVIKDDFSMLKNESTDPRLSIRGAFIRDSLVLGQYIMINIRTKYFAGFYKFYFDYNNSKSLRLLLNLIKQKNLFIILCDNNNEFFQEIILDNKMKLFFKEYIEKCLKLDCKWHYKDYNNMLKKIENKYFDDYYLWKQLGQDIVGN